MSSTFATSLTSAWSAVSGVLRERLSGPLARVRVGLIWTLKVTVAAALMAGGFAGWRLVERYAHTTPYFAIQTVHIEGLDRLDRDGVLRSLGVQEGDNVFSIDPVRSAERLERNPWIATATVTRRLPGTVSITVEERRAVAVLALGSCYLVGDDGSLFKALEQSDPADLPVITGLDEQRFLGDTEFRARVLLEVVTLMHDYRSAGLWAREPIAEIHFEADEGLSIYAGDDGMFVRLGGSPWRPKLRKLRQILDRLDTHESRAEYVLLDNVRRPERVTVRLRQEPEPVVVEAPVTEEHG